MVVRSDKEKSSHRKAEQFYEVIYPPRELPSGREFLNQDELCRGSGSVILAAPSRFQRGFRNYSVRPRFLVSKRLGRKPYDIERCSEYWLISDRAKQLFDEGSESDFTYLAVDTELDPGSDPTTYWLCDIVTVLDAVDEARSGVKSRIADDGSRVHQIVGSYSLAFDEKSVGQRCVFRMKTSFNTLICNERFKLAVKHAQLTGLTFKESFQPPFEMIGTVTALPPPFGEIKPMGRRKEILFLQDLLDNLGESLKVGETVRVQGRRDRYHRSYLATRLEKI